MRASVYLKQRDRLLPGKTLVGFETHLRELFGLVQEFLGVVREEFVEGCEADFSLEEVLFLLSE